MNCRQAERWLLLASSGELPPRKLAILKRHVGQCSSCAAFRGDLERIAESASRALAAEEPSPVALSAIMRAARNEAPSERPQRRRAFAQRRHAAAGALALAASLLVCVGLRHILREGILCACGSRGPAAVSASVEGQIPASDWLEHFAAERWNETAYIERFADLSEDLDVTLAEKELMILEGLAI